MFILFVVIISLVAFIVMMNGPAGHVPAYQVIPAIPFLVAFIISAIMYDTFFAPIENGAWN